MTIKKAPAMCRGFLISLMPELDTNFVVQCPACDVWTIFGYRRCPGCNASIEHCDGIPVEQFLHPEDGEDEQN